MLNYSYYVDVVIRAYILSRIVFTVFFGEFVIFPIFLPLALRLAHSFLPNCKDQKDNVVDYQALHEDWDDIFRGMIHASAGCVDDEEEEVHQSEANKFFTPTRKRKATEINDQTLNTQMFLSIIRKTNENMLTYSTKEEVLEIHSISADLRSTTIRMQGKQLIDTARGETNLPANDMQLALTNATGNVADADEFYNIVPAAILKSNTKRDPIGWFLTFVTVF
jgi:hypothetical protein